MAVERLDKCLVKLGLCTRSEAKKWVLAGRLRVNEELVKKAEQKLDTGKDVLYLDGAALDLSDFVYYVLHKPGGCVCALRDAVHKTVMDYIEEKRKGLVPVGRLDMDTEGILLLTDDGALNHRLLAPGKHVPKLYYAEITGRLPEDAVEQFRRGIVLSEGPCKEAKLRILKKGENFSEIELEISEGRFHQVKRMFHALSCEVRYLKRIAFAGLILDEFDLAPGEYRRLTEEEIARLQAF